jgi:ABC-2 type transport system permease protein
MSAVIALALKDLRLLFRVRSALFFTMVWPVLVAVLFGLLFGGSGRPAAPLPIVVVDDDGTAGSKALVEALLKREGFDAIRASATEARDLVRRGQRVAAVRLPPGFGPASERLFYGAPPQIELFIDPTRSAETAMLQGLLFEQASARMQTAFADRSQGRSIIAGAMGDLATAPAGTVPGQEALRRMLGELGTFMEAQAAAAPAGGTAAPAWKPLEVQVLSVVRQRTGPRNGFDVAFPQGIIWGILGCMMSFAVSIAVERTHGTLTRLRMSPVPGWALLAGKALACYLAILLVQAMLGLLGILVFGVRPGSPALLLMVALIAPMAFVGIMMLVASIGANEQAASGAGWAIMMPLSMVGGAMIPLVFMPAWMTAVSHASPVKWAILAYEGAIWRGFSAGELLLPCAILLTIGAATFSIGAKRFDRV